MRVVGTTSAVLSAYVSVCAEVAIDRGCRMVDQCEIHPSLSSQSELTGMMNSAAAVRGFARAPSTYGPEAPFLLANRDDLSQRAAMEPDSQSGESKKST
jgi:hypothetical protein